MKKALLIFFTVVFFAASSILSALAADTAAAISLPITQSVSAENRGSTVSVQVTYTLTALTDDAPMPEGSVNGVYTFLLKDNDTVKLPEVAPTKPGTWDYSLTAKASDGSVTPAQITITLTAMSAASGQEPIIVCKTVDGQKTELHFDVTPPDSTPTPTPTAVPTPVPSAAPTPGRTPKTGDTTHVQMVEGITAISGMILLFSLMLILREQRDADQ